MKIFNLFAKKKKEALDQGLAKTKSSFFSQLSKVLIGKSKVDEEVLEQLEENLIAADVGVETTIKIIQQIEARVARDKYLSTQELNTLLRQEIASLLPTSSTANEDLSMPYCPYVVLVVGVNGVGKTTTLGKLAAQYKQQGKKVLLGAADTFRAAAVAQLQEWGKKIDVPVVAHGMHTDPASVAYDAVQQGLSTQADVVLIDTAGRLHTKVNLMNQLAKIKRVIQKALPQAPHEVLLVLDGSTGQNAFMQARAFTQATQVTALAITKLDSTAKGGVVIGIADQFNIPVKYIGVGEGIEHLQVFDKEHFIESLFGTTAQK